MPKLVKITKKWNCSKCSGDVFVELDYNCECAGGVCQNCNEANCNCGQRNYTPHEQTCAVETKRAEGDKFVQDKIQGHKLNCTGKTTMEKETSHNCSEIKTEISVFQQQITELNNSLTKITKELESTKNDLVIERKINADLNNKLLESSKQQEPNSLNTVIDDLKEEVKYLKESTTNKEGGLTIPVWWLLVLTIISVFSFIARILVRRKNKKNKLIEKKITPPSKGG